MNLAIRARLSDDKNDPLKANKRILLIRDGIINDILDDEQFEDGSFRDYQVFDLPDLHILPGLIDSHVHLLFDADRTLLDQSEQDSDPQLLFRGIQNASLSLSSGVTFVRDVGAKNELIFPLRDAIRDNLITGPDILASGCVITTRLGHCWYFGHQAQSEEEIRSGIQTQVKSGADLIKVMASGGRITPQSSVGSVQYSVDQLKIVVDEARKHGLKVAAHASSSASIENCVQAGIDTIEHCAWYGPDGKTFQFIPDLVDQMVDKNIYINHATLPHPFIFKDKSKLNPNEVEWFETSKRRWGALQTMQDAGVKLILSTDAVYGLWPDGTDLARAAQILVTEAGFSPTEVINMITSTAAEGLGIESRVGSLEKGKRADLILLEANPHHDISTLINPMMVMKAGEIVAQRQMIKVQEKRYDDYRVVKQTQSNPWIK